MGLWIGALARGTFSYQTGETSAAPTPRVTASVAALTLAGAAPYANWNDASMGW